MLWALGVAIICAALAAYALFRAAASQARIRDLEASQRTAFGRSAEQLNHERRALDALREDYDALLDRCGVGVLMVDGKGAIERANLAARQLLAVPSQAVDGKRLLQATLSEELDSIFKIARETRVPQEREMRATGGAGSALVVTVSPIGSLANDITANPRYIVVVRDVTELRRLETVRRDFVANVSHELRTPLTSIRAMAETLQEGALEDLSVAGRFLGTIVNETQRLTRIAEDLLVLSDAESHMPEKALVSLSRMTEEITVRFRPQAEKSGLLLTYDIAPNIEAYVNADQLEQVVVNLIDNAIKYTGSGGKIHVSAESREDFAALHVADTGIGIMSQDVPRIFERFYRVDKARSRQSGGTGLGLSIVKHIVEAHGGSVTVDSEYNRGSVFTISLPLPANRPASVIGGVQEQEPVSIANAIH